jgi:hypothetical protein
MVITRLSLQMTAHHVHKNLLQGGLAEAVCLDAQLPARRFDGTKHRWQRRARRQRKARPAAGGRVGRRCSQLRRRKVHDGGLRCCIVRAKHLQQVRPCSSSASESCCKVEQSCKVITTASQHAVRCAPPYRLFRRCGLPTQASLPACMMPTRLQRTSTWAAR